MEGSRIRVSAYIERYGRTSETYLLTDIRDAFSDAALCDHMWIEIGSWAQGFRDGDRIEFLCTVIPYVKGYLGNVARVRSEAPSPSIDWKLGEIDEARVIAFGPKIRMMPDGTIKP
jgi:hypothetical protein